MGPRPNISLFIVLLLLRGIPTTRDKYFTLIKVIFQLVEL